MIWLRSTTNCAAVKPRSDRETDSTHRVQSPVSIGEDWGGCAPAAAAADAGSAGMSEDRVPVITVCETASEHQLLAAAAKFRD